jgi:hypothetical protein
MTFDRKIIVGIEDIKSVTLECSHCQVRMTFSPDSVSIPNNCPNPSCNKIWVSPQFPHANPFPTTESKTPVQIKLIQAIAGVRHRSEENKIERPKEPIGFRILLEFEEPVA